MQFRRSHLPSVPRAATYSCSLTTRSPRKKTASTQTDKYFSQFENWFDSGRTSRGELAFDEETTKTYCMALEFVNSFHCYMNEKLGEKYRECADTKPEGDAFFKLPEVPNYAAIFFMLLEKTKGPKSASNEEYVLERKTNNLEHELETKKCPTELSERVVLERKETLEETKTIEQEALTIVSHLKDDDSVSCSTSKKSCNVHSRASGEDPEQKKESTTEETCDTVSNNQKMENDEGIGEKEVAGESQTLNGDGHERIMMDIIRERVQEEITTYLDKNSASGAKSDRPRLVRSHFHVVNIAPQINLLEYAQKKLERRTNADSKPEYLEPNQKQLLNDPVSGRKPSGIAPNVPNKVTDMFRRLSQENFRGLGGALGGDILRCELNQSDEDSIILDDEEFDKINGHTGEQNDKQQKRNRSASKEKSSPLKLTVRDMSRVNEKVLNTIGLFTERGDIRPGIIDILEEQKRAKAKDARNKQFRSRRQWDLQVHLNPKEEVGSSFTSVSTERSFISLSSVDLKSEFETVKNVCQQIEYNK